MIAPDDPRHGKHRGYVMGCREECCTHAHMLYMKLYRMGRRNRLVSPLGTNRRIDALACLGWSMQEIAYRCGFQNEWIYNLRRSTQITSKTAARIAKVYDDMSMAFPPERTRAEKSTATRARTRARLGGYLPPLAWDDIDDPNERPAKVYSHAKRVDRDHVDPIVIERVLSGDRQPMTTKERREVVARARALGWSEETIYARTGIAKATDAARYGEREAS